MQGIRHGRRSLFVASALGLTLAFAPVMTPAASADSCVETPALDVGWVCGPDVDPAVTVTLSPNVTVVDLVAPPDDATLIDPVPDPFAPEPVPYVSVETDTAVPSTTSLNCKSYGTATWLAPDDNLCPPIHWYRGYFYVNDRTGSAWPVSAKTTYWNGVSRLSVGYGCPSSYHCVQVVEGKYGATPWVGRTTYTYSQGTHNFASATIQLNDSYAMTAAQRAQTVCMELGHAAGLGHETQNNSCMWYKIDGLHPSGNSNDFNQLTYHTYQ